MQPGNISHRGDNQHAPENTLPAFELAFQRGANGIECDVQCTRDGVLIVMHDEDIRRTTRGWKKGLPSYNVKDLDWSFVAELDAGSWFSEEFAGTHVPRLEEVLKMGGASGGRICYIDVKDTSTTDRAISRLAWILKHHSHTTGFDVHVGFWDLMGLANANTMRIDNYAHLSFIAETPPEDVGRFSRLRVSSFNIDHTKLTRKWVIDASALGFMVFAHVPNTHADKHHCIQKGVGNMITDVVA